MISPRTTRPALTKSTICSLRLKSLRWARPKSAISHLRAKPLHQSRLNRYEKTWVPRRSTQTAPNNKMLALQPNKIASTKRQTHSSLSNVSKTTSTKFSKISTTCGLESRRPKPNFLSGCSKPQEPRHQILIQARKQPLARKVTLKLSTKKTQFYWHLRKKRKRLTLKSTFPKVRPWKAPRVYGSQLRCTTRREWI